MARRKDRSSAKAATIDCVPMGSATQTGMRHCKYHRLSYSVLFVRPRSCTHWSTCTESNLNTHYSCIPGNLFTLFRKHICINDFLILIRISKRSFKKNIVVSQISNIINCPKHLKLDLHLLELRNNISMQHFSEGQLRMF